LPQASVEVQVTFVVVLPVAGAGNTSGRLLVTVTELQLSELDGERRATVESSQHTNTSAEQAIVGACVSRIVNVAVVCEALPHASVAVKVTVA
jgi:hypothetical protein